MSRLTRRTVLRGLGVCLALPWLESLRRHATARASSDGPKRLVVLYLANGAYPASWRPGSVGASWTPSSLLSPLADQVDRVSVLTGLENTAGRAERSDAPNHVRFATSALTGVPPVWPGDGAEVEVGVSFDQLVAAQVGGETSFPSLVLGSESAAICDFEPCLGLNHVSWGEDGPVAKDLQPRRVFERLFGVGGTVDETRAMQTRWQRRQSVLDFVKQDLERVSASVGASDRQRLDAYLTGLRELERQLEQPVEGCGQDSWPFQTVDHSDHVDQMLALTRLALQCDRTRVVSYMMSNERSHIVPDWLGSGRTHHAMSHHMDQPDSIAQYDAVVQWHMSRVAVFLQGLADAPEGSGSVLDHSAVLVMSGMGDGNAHSPEDLPVLLAGGLCGELNPGRHVVFASGTPVANLQLTLLQRMGVNASTFGDGVATLDEI